MSAVNPDTKFRDLEPLVCDAEHMVDVMYSFIEEAFADAPADGRHTIDAVTAERIFFTAGLAVEMTRKAKDAFYIAFKNEAGKGGGD